MLVMYVGELEEGKISTLFYSFPKPMSEPTGGGTSLYCVFLSDRISFWKVWGYYWAALVNSLPP